MAAADRSLTPENADPVQVLSFVTAYLESLVAVAEDLGEHISIAGLELREGSVEIVMHVDKLPPVQFAARELAKAMTLGDLPAPLKRLRAAIARFPDDVHADVRVGKWTGAIERSLRSEQPLRELSTLRAQLIRVGGIRPAVRLRSEDRDFSLEADALVLRELGPLLYREIEIEAEVERDDVGNITDGRVISYSVLDDGEPVDAWQKWFDSTAGEWNEDQVKEFLGDGRN